MKLYFDKETGLLSRSVRYTDSPVGLNPTQIDYSDYREVAGTKGFPFQMDHHLARRPFPPPN